MRRTTVVAVAALVSSGCFIKGREQTAPQLFTWTGTLAAQSTVRLRNTNGSVVVVPSTDGHVHVVASASWRKGNPARDMHFAVVPSGNDVTICALWGNGTCTANSYHSSTRLLNRILGHTTDATVILTVYLPPRLLVDASTVNGDVIVTASAPVRAHTINGGIKVGTAVGPVDAVTVNGNVDVRMTTLSGTGPVRAESVTGSVSAWLPDTLNADVSLASVTGSVTADYGLEGGKNKITATIGSGGRNVSVKSVTGSARLGRLAADGSIAKP